MSWRVVVLAALVVAPGCRGREPRAAFGTAWRQAVVARDGVAAWGLLDAASRARITDGLARAQVRAAGDELWRERFVWVNRPVDVINLPPEELGPALIGPLLGRGIDLVDDGKTNRIHREKGKWVAAVDPAGFVDPDGVPLTLTGLWIEAPAAAQGAAELIHVRWADRLVSEIDADYAKEGARLAEKNGLGPAYADAVTRIMQVYAFHGTGERSGPTEYQVEPDGSITAILHVWRGRPPTLVAAPEPRLAFGPWPGHN